MNVGQRDTGLGLAMSTACGPCVHGWEVGRCQACLEQCGSGSLAAARAC